MKKLVLSSMFAACGATALLLPAACGKTPTAPAVSFSAPLPTQANGASYGFGLQPITLTLTNAACTGQSVVTYTVEVATDSGFGSKVFTKDGVPEGANGKTNVELGSLAGGQTYYWHSMAVIDGVVGAQSPTQTFSVRPQIFTGVPTIASPNANDNVFGSRPSFTVNNVGHTSAAGTVFYEFQVASSAAFTTILASGSSQETPGRTSWSPGNDLPEGNLFWRARATDPSNSEATAYTSSSGTTFNLKPFDLSLATILNNPPDLASWAVTTSITKLEIRPRGVHIDFSKKDGPDRWRDVIPPGFSGAIQYTMGMVLNIGGRWYASAAIEMWYGLDEGGGPPGEFALNWFYDPRRWAPMTGHQPAVGETVGFFVVAGDVRGHLDVSQCCTYVKERSNVVFVPMPDGNGASFSFLR